MRQAPKASSIVDDGLPHPPVSLMYVGRQAGSVVILTSAIAALYLELPKVELFVMAIMLAALLPYLTSSSVLMRPCDWNLVLLLASEVPSLLFSQDRANSIRTTEAIIIAVAVFFAIRVAVRSAWQVACLSALLALAGCCIALPEMAEFHRSAVALSQGGFSTLVAFRSNLITPRAHWTVTEWFTIDLLLLPFAAAIPAYFWKKNKLWPAV